MYDLHSSPVVSSGPVFMASSLTKHVHGMTARRHHQPPRRPIRNVIMAWLHPDDPLAVSTTKRRANISCQGEHLEVETIEAVDDSELGNLVKTSRRYNSCTVCRLHLDKAGASCHSAGSKGIDPTCVNRYNDEIIEILSDGSDDDNGGNAVDDEISLELQRYDQGPIFLANPPEFRYRSKRTSSYRPMLGALEDVVTDVTNELQELERDVGALSDAEKDGEEDENKYYEKSNASGAVEQTVEFPAEVKSDGEPEYDEVPSTWRMKQPGQSTIYVKPADARFDLTSASPGTFRLTKTSCKEQK